MIILGGAAFVCELSIGDEVISMNGMTVATLTQVVHYTHAQVPISSS